MSSEIIETMIALQTRKQSAIDNENNEVTIEGEDRVISTLAEMQLICAGFDLNLSDAYEASYYIAAPGLRIIQSDLAQGKDVSPLDMLRNMWMDGLLTGILYKLRQEEKRVDD